jgi:hypothetical protein
VFRHLGGVERGVGPPMTTVTPLSRNFSAIS